MDCKHPTLPYSDLIVPFFLPARVIVDYRSPVQVDGFHIYWDNELAGVDGKSVHAGLTLHKEVDPRWTFDFPQHTFFQGRIWSDNCLLIGFIAHSYDHIYNVDEFSSVSTEVFNAMDEQRNAIVEQVRDGLVPKRWVLLEFPPRPGMKAVKLSVKEIFRNEDHLDETSLELKYWPVKSGHKITKMSLTWWATWSVVVTDPDDGESEDRHRKRGKPDLRPKQSAAAEQAEAFDGIYSSSPPAPPDDMEDRGVQPDDIGS